MSSAPVVIISSPHSFNPSTDTLEAPYEFPDPPPPPSAATPCPPPMVERTFSSLSPEPGPEDAEGAPAPEPRLERSLSQY